MSTRQAFTTDPPAITDADLSRIRAAAHQYLLAGGPLFVDHGEGAGNQDSHIGNIRQARHPEAAETFEHLLKQHVPEHAPHEQTWSAAWELASFEAEAGYLFGLCVGLELAALTAHGVTGDLTKAVRR